VANAGIDPSAPLIVEDVSPMVVALAGVDGVSFSGGFDEGDQV